ncbi:lactate utilization protein C [Cellulomonas cellasea]|uniref:L-lactate dehydrogenase complex protein LldG n=1 Tax=Cellulomonas cellasea TaxID=43670 RepID=A0A7W4UDF9_9CELL|nr:lactate utilization protein C [Cellulomonas cellasea]MBB2921799.1 L-lactate dehydrogenase complex protein LldG [Cellulomonas cellasea]
MTAREEVLAAVRAALGRGPDGAPASPAPGGPRAGHVPRAYRVATGTAPGSVAACDLLEHRLLDYRARVTRCGPDDVAATVARELAGAASVAVPHGLPEAWVDAVRAGGASVLADEPGRPLGAAALDRTDAVVTGCRVAVADTGTIVLDAGPGQGRRVLSLVPDRHVCVVRADQVVGSVPEAVRLLEAHPGRPLTWISGPSATSDIELVRVEGVHGPRDLRVVLVGP